MAQTISTGTRRNILDLLIVEQIPWWGRLSEIDFLGRVWLLSGLPSTDSRFRDAEGDIWQHRFRNPEDWSDDWIYHDPRFDLAGCPDELFLKFLCELVHPVVREDAEEVGRLVAMFNECLAADDWHLVPVSRLRLRPVYAGRRRSSVVTPTTALAFERYEGLDDPEVLRQHLRRIDEDLEADPSAAIGWSKELAESVCKLILDDYGVSYSGRDDLLDLYKKVAAELALNAEAVPDSTKGSKAAQQTLRTLVTTLQSLAELRNELGSGHGRAKLSPAWSRHARLAFHATVTVCDFLIETWHVRRAADTS